MRICDKSSTISRDRCLAGRRGVSLPQAAEKLVKAALVKAGLAFPKTHDIAALVGLLPAQHRLKDKFRSFEKLTPFGVAYRYPAEDEWEIPSAEAIETWRKEIETVRSMF